MTPDQMRDASLLDLFRMEAEAQKQVLDTGLLVLERDAANAAQLEACMRAAHSLKGAARIVGLELGVQVAHAMEDLLVAAQEGRLRLSPEHIDALLQGSDLLLRVGQAQPDADIGVQTDSLTARLQMLQGGAPAPHMAASVGLPGEPEQPRAASAAPVADVSTEERSRVLRVSAERFDHLIDLSGKSLVEFQRMKPLGDSLLRLKRQQESLRRTLESLREQTLGNTDGVLQTLLDEGRNQLLECQHQLQEHQTLFDDFAWRGGQRTQQLHDLALASRMRPFADVLAGQARMLRDLGRSLGKQVRLEVEGESTQVDRDVLERLEAPLTHLLRNAVDHGIELPAVRVQNGKQEEGRVLLRARHHAGMLVLEIGDDGAGVDLERVRQAVVARNFASTEQVGRMSEDELLAFLFLPGFSMNQQVTEVSGRGVGLDVVQHEVRRMRGNVRLQQVPGEGSRFHIELPLTMSVVRALVVSIGGEAYAFPLAQIERMLRLQRSDIVQLEGRQHFWLEDEHVGLLSAAQLLQCPETKGEDDSIPIVLIRDRERFHGLAVEAFLGEFTLVLMPLDPRLGKTRDVAGGALLHDGTPVLILDVDDLLNSVGKLLGDGQLDRVDQSAGERQVASKRVLVVDDSLTVRELERKLLLGRGYQVAVAVDGMDGWNALRAEHFDLLITDIDMPRMDGIELVTLVRQDPRLRSLPVMVVSYKDREEDRRRGLEAGADYYLAKASFHDEALLDAVQTLIGGGAGMKIAIANDMPLAVEALRRALAAEPQYQLIWVAENGEEAVRRCREDLPDLLLMDMLMPGMGGVEATRLIMRDTPCAILIVTSDVERNMTQVFDAMGHGALDVVAAPSLGPKQVLDAATVRRKIHNITWMIGHRVARNVTPIPRRHSDGRGKRLVAIGASAGGPASLVELLKQLPANFPAAIVLVQHVDEVFAAGMAQWLGSESRIPVRLAREGETVQAGEVLLAGTNNHLYLSADGRLAYRPEPINQVYRPSIDVFFESVAAHWQGEATGVLLTGMGRDGAQGLKLMRERGFHTIAQDEASCAVYGMPKAAVALGAAVEVLPLDRIATRLIERLSQ